MWWSFCYCSSVVKTPEAETVGSVGPGGSGWRWSCPGSPCSYCGRLLSAGPPSAPLSSPWSNYTQRKSVWMLLHSTLRDISAEQLLVQLPVFILCLSNRIHQDLETLPSHVAALFVEVKGYVTEDRRHSVKVWQTFFVTEGAQRYAVITVLKESTVQSLGANTIRPFTCT